MSNLPKISPSYTDEAEKAYTAVEKLTKRYRAEKALAASVSYDNVPEVLKGQFVATGGRKSHKRGTMNKQEALKKIIDAAGVHADRMNETIANGEATGTFAEARKRYVRELQVAVSEVAGTRFDDSGKVSERVRDLDLAESVALLHAVEDHVRSIAGYSRHA